MGLKSLSRRELNAAAAAHGVPSPEKLPNKDAVLRAVQDAGAGPSVVVAVRADLRDLARLDRRLANGALAASALAMARELDDPDNSATSKSMCARSLLDTLERLREMAPEPHEEDGVDALAARRAARLAR